MNVSTAHRHNGSRALTLAEYEVILRIYLERIHLD